jgi:hypothetical protein
VEDIVEKKNDKGYKIADYRKTRIPWYDPATADNQERILIWRFVRNKSGGNTFTSVRVGTAVDDVAADRLITCLKEQTNGTRN